MLTSTMAGLACPKCSNTKKSGRRSCCARGGAWFKNCGDADDIMFDHTWAEGIQACKGRLWRGSFCAIHHGVVLTPTSPAATPATTSPHAVSSSNECPKCTTNKAGKPSCCARGGSWFNNCGDAGDTQSAHTWVEGIQVCKVFATSVSVKPPVQVTRTPAQAIHNPLSAVHSQREQTHIYHSVSMHNAMLVSQNAKTALALQKFLYAIVFYFYYLNL